MLPARGAESIESHRSAMPGEACWTCRKSSWARTRTRWRDHICHLGLELLLPPEDDELMWASLPMLPLPPLPPYQPRPGEVEKGSRMDYFVPALIVFIFIGFQKADKGWRKWKLDEFDLNRWWRLMLSSSWRRKRLPWHSKKKRAQAHPVSIMLQDVSTTWFRVHQVLKRLALVPLVSSNLL